MKRSSIAETLKKLAHEIDALSQLVDKQDGGVSFLSGKWKQTAVAAKDKTAQLAQFTEALNEQFEWLQQTIDNLPEGVLLLDRDGKVIVSNSRADKVLGLGADEETLSAWMSRQQFFTKQDSDSTIENADSAFGKVLAGQSLDKESVFFREKGNTNSPTGLFVTSVVDATDKSNVLVFLTEIQPQEQGILKKLELLNEAIRDLNQGIIIIDPSGAFLTLNPAAQKWMQITKNSGRISEWNQTHEVRAKAGGPALPPHSNPFVRAIAGKKIQGESVFIFGKGEDKELAVEINAYSVNAKDANPLFALVISDVYNANAGDQAAKFESLAADHRAEVAKFVETSKNQLQEIAKLKEAVGDREKKMAKLEEVVSQRDEKITRLETSLAELSTKEDGLDASLTERNDAMAALQSSLTERDEAVAALQSRLAERDEATTALQNSLSERDKAVAALQSTLAERDEAVTALQSSLTERNERVEQLQASLAQRDDRAVKLVSSLAEQQKDSTELTERDETISELRTSISDQRDKLAALEDLLAEKDQQIRSLEAKLSRQTQTGAEEQSTQLKAIVESSDDAIVLLTADGDVLNWNDGAEKTFGYTANDVANKPLKTVFAPESVDSLLESIQRAQRGERLKRFELTGLKEDQTKITVSAQISPVMNMDGTIIGVSAIMRDISEKKLKEHEIVQLNEKLATQVSELTTINQELERKENEITRLNRELAEQVAQLTEINEQVDDTARRLLVARDESRANAKFKSLFLSTMGREIRTPMNAIMGLADVLSRIPGMSDEHKDYAFLIRDAGATLLNVFGDIIEYTKLEGGQLRLDDVEFSLAKTLEDAGDTIVNRAKHKKLSLLTFVAPEVPQLLVGDGARLKQVIERLADAAIGVTERGGVVIRATLMEIKDKQATIRIAFSDTGTGMTSQAAKDVFKAISQTAAEDKSAPNYLGLTIAKRLVQLMKGELGVESNALQGAMFWLTLTLPLADKKSEPIVIPEPVKEARVLVVDGPAGASRVISAYCAAWGVHCDWVVTGDEALAAMQKQVEKGVPYSIVVMEKVMFGMNGLALATEIAKLPALQQTRLILFAPYGEVQPEFASNAGFSRIIQGPLNQTLFLETLIALSTSEAPGRNLFVTSGRHTAIDMKVVKQLLQPSMLLMAEDNPINQKVSMLQLNELGLAAHVVSNGREAVSAFKRGQYALILMDCEMPDMDGFEATKAIRALEAETVGSVSRIPIIAMTANAVDGDREKCLDAGMTDYISKPVESFELCAVLERWLPKISDVVVAAGRVATPATVASQPANEQLPGLALDLEQPAKEQKRGSTSNGDNAELAHKSNRQAGSVAELMDLERLKKICGQAGMEELIKEFLSTTEDLLNQMEAAIEQKNASVRRRIAHEIKGSAGALGAAQVMQFSNAIQTLEPDDWEQALALHQSLRASVMTLKLWCTQQLQH